MVAAWAVILSALVYLCLLFAVAHWGDLSGRRIMKGRARSTIYALSLAVYCTSWTFFGSVGLATRSGLDFLTIYIGPILVIGLGQTFVSRVVQIAKAQNITSIADFVAARYGKSERVAALVSLIALIGSIPYIALQLKAVSASLSVFLSSAGGVPIPEHTPIYRRSRARRGDGARGIFGRLRDAAHGRDGAPGRADDRDLARIRRQACRLPGRRQLCDLRDVRRLRRFDGPSRRAPPFPRHAQSRVGTGRLLHAHPPVELRGHAAAAPVPHDSGREPLGRGCHARRVAVSALSRSDQHLRHPDRPRRPCGVPQRRDRQGHDGARAAALRRCGLHCACCLSRRSLRRNRHGHCRVRRGRDHDLEPSRDAGRAQATRLCGRDAAASDEGPHRVRARRQARRDRRRASPRLCLLPGSGRCGTRHDRASFLRGHCPDRAFLRRRPHLVARHGARRECEPRRRLRNVDLHAARCRASSARACSGRTF